MSIDNLVTQIGAWMLEQGPLGVLCLLLLYAVYRLWSVVETVQEKRIEEAKENARMLQEYTRSLATLTDFYRNNNNSGSQIRDESGGGSSTNV